MKKIVLPKAGLFVLACIIVMELLYYSLIQHMKNSLESKKRNLPINGGHSFDNATSLYLKAIFCCNNKINTVKKASLYDDAFLHTYQISDYT
jgi:hypothetical protein